MNQVVGLDVFGEFLPALESMLAGDHQLGIGQRNMRGSDLGVRSLVEAGMMALDTGEHLGITETAIPDEILGLLLVLFEVGTGG